MTLRPLARLGSLALVILAGACSSSPASTSSGASATSGSAGSTSAAPTLAGTYKATTAGGIAEITFFAPDGYALLRGPCDDQADDCVEKGTYALAAGDASLTLTPDDGTAATTLPFQTLLADDDGGADATTAADDLHVDSLVMGGTSLVCAPSRTPLVQSAAVSGQQLVQASTGSPSSGWPGCSGTFDTHGSPTGQYFVTDFGCSSSPSFTDSGDNCCGAGVVAAASQGLCAAGTSTSGCTSSKGTTASIACERAVNWFSTGGSVYGRGARLRLTGTNGKSVVVFVIDDGPACYRERDFGGYAIDVSYPAAMYLFGMQVGTPDRAQVHVDVVDASTPLGPVTGSSPPVTDPADAGTGGTTLPTCPAGSSCKTDGDCNPGSEGAGLICTNNQCVAGCRTSAQCPGSTTCVSGQCSGGASATTVSGGGKACTSDGACNPGNDGAGLVCTGGSCAPGCKANWYCPGSQTCRDGQCQ